MSTRDDAVAAWYFDRIAALRRIEDDAERAEVIEEAVAVLAAREGQAGAEPFAYFVYIPAEQRGEFVHELDDAVDDLTNCECKVTELFARPAPVAQQPASVWQPAPASDAASGLRILLDVETSDRAREILRDAIAALSTQHPPARGTRHE